MQKPLNCGVSGCQNYPIRITLLFCGQVCRHQRVLVFLVFIFCVRKLLYDLSLTACGSPHNRKSVRNNSPDTKSNKKGLEASNVKGKNLCNLTTLKKPTNFLGQYMYWMCLKQHWRLAYVKRSRGQSRNFLSQRRSFRDKINWQSIIRNIPLKKWVTMTKANRTHE